MSVISIEPYTSPSNEDRDADRRSLIAKSQQFADLSEYSLKKRLMIRALDLGFYGMIQAIGRTLRYDVQGWEHWHAIANAAKQPIYTFWHDSIIPSTYFWRGRNIVVMTSQSFDGEYIARFIQRFGYGAARGSSTRGSIGALIEMIRLMREGLPAAFTIDGPKGPRRIAKMGSVLLAKKTGNPILAFSATSRQRWQTKSWDRLEIPKPFSTVRLEMAPPIYVPTNANELLQEAKRCELQRVLDEMSERGERWREGTPQTHAFKQAA